MDLHKKSSTNQTAEVLVKDKLLPPLDLVTVSLVHKISKPNCRIVPPSFVVSLVGHTLFTHKKGVVTLKNFHDTTLS